MSDRWSSGDAYEPYVGRWSRLVAREFVDWLAVPRGLRWLEIGCGTGALTRTILAHAQPASVHAYDASPDYVAYAKHVVADERVSFDVARADALPEDDASLDVVVSGLVLNFLPDAVAALKEQRRVSASGATIAAYVWDYAGAMQFMRHFWDAAVELNPAARELDEGVRFPLCRPDALRGAFMAAELSHVKTRAIDAPTVFRDFDDYWQPFLGGQGPAPGYLISLASEQRDALRASVQRRLPMRADGTIPLIARAWAIRGEVPAA